MVDTPASLPEILAKAPAADHLPHPVPGGAGAGPQPAGGLEGWACAVGKANRAANPEPQTEPVPLIFPSGYRDEQLAVRKEHVLVWQGKGGRARNVPLNVQARKALQDWLAVRPDQKMV